MHLINLIVVGAILCITVLNTTSFAAEGGNYSLNRVTTLIGQKDDIDAVIFSPDSNQLATGGDDNLIIIWDSKTWKEIRRLKGHKDSVRSIAFSSNGKILASGDSGHKVVLWDIETGKELRRIKVSDDINSVIFSPDGKHLAIASDSKNLLFWNISSEIDPLKFTGGHNNDINAVVISRDGKFLASGGSDKSVIIWEADTGKIHHKFIGHSDDVKTIAFTPNGKYLASGGKDNKIILWDLATGTTKKTFTGNFNSIKALAFVDNGEVLVSGEGDSKFNCKIRFWGTESGKLLASERSDCSFTNFSFSPDEKIVAIAAKKISIMKRDLTLSAPQDEQGVNAPLEVSDVRHVPGLSADVLYLRAHEWFVNNFVSANNVIQLADKENGIIMGKGSFNYFPDTNIGYVGLSGFIQFTVKIILKEGRYKYIFTDFRHAGTPVVAAGGFVPGIRKRYEIKYGLLTNSDSVPESVEYGRSGVWNHMREVSYGEAISMSDTLKAQMNIPIKGKNDW